MKLKWMSGEIQVESPHPFAIRGFSFPRQAGPARRTSSSVHAVTFRQAVIISSSTGVPGSSFSVMILDFMKWEYLVVVRENAGFYGGTLASLGDKGIKTKISPDLAVKP